MDKEYTVAIIGAGSIGALKPDKYDSPSTKNVLTHAHAVYNHPRTKLVAIVDLFKEKAQVAANKWRCHPYTDWQDIPDRTDIIIVAVPTDMHSEILWKIAQLEPRIVIAEKPFTSSIVQGFEISDLYKRSQIPIAVNYTRRYIPEYKEIKETIEKHPFGRVMNCSLYYTRGLKREGCHAIDLFNYFFGKFKDGTILLDNYICDFSEKDKTCAAYFQYEECPHIFMFPCNGRKFAIFEMDIIFEEGRIKLTDHGLRILKYGLISEIIYDDTKVINPYPFDNYGTRLSSGLSFLLDNVVGFLDGKEKLLCTDKDALAVHEVYHQLGL